MPQGFGATIVKLALLSLAVGLVLTFFDITPEHLLLHFGATVRSVFHLVSDAVRWAVPYVLLGATVVVPIWLIAHLWHSPRNPFR
mgnify:CR=1 FL=1